MLYNIIALITDLSTVTSQDTTTTQTTVTDTHHNNTTDTTVATDGNTTDTTTVADGLVPAVAAVTLIVFVIVGIAIPLIVILVRRLVL